jgi:streptogramin lyase
MKSHLGKLMSRVSRDWRSRQPSASALRRRSRLVIEALEGRELLASITEFPIPGHPYPSAITSGRDGNLWFAAVNDIEAINPTTDEFIGPYSPSDNSDLYGLTAGPDGNIWFTESVTTYNGLNPPTTTYNVGVFNLTTHAISEFPIPSANTSAYQITSGPDGNLWFTENSASGGKIGMINPTTHVISEYSVPVSGSGLYGITAGPDGNLWFTDAGTNHIGMINPASHAISEYSVPDQYSGPQGITAGPDGKLWFTEQSINELTSSGTFTGTSEIATIDPSTHVFSQYPISISGTSPLAIAAGADGNLWFTDYGTSDVGMINPSSHAIAEYAPPTSSSLPYAITAGPDGNLWFVENVAGAIGVVTLPSAAATHLAVTSQPPGNVPASTPFGLTVTAENSAGQVASTFNGSVTVALAANPGGATLGGTLTVMAHAGVATFSGLTLDQSANGYTLSITGPGLAETTSNPFNVTATAPTQLVVTTAPPGMVSANAGFEVFVSAENAANRVVGAFNGSVTVTLGNNPGGSELGGTVSVTARNGVAAFTNLTLNQPGLGYTLQFASGSFSVATSAFNVTPAAAITQIATPATNRMPSGITTAPGGNLWFVEPGGDDVASVNPVTGKVTEYPIPTAGSGADRIALGPDGDLWFNEPNIGKVAQLSPATGAIKEIDFPGGGVPESMAADAFGEVVFTDSLNNSLDVYDTFNQTFSAPTTVPTTTSGLDEITPGPNGQLWFTETSANQIGRFDPQLGGVIEFRPPTAFSGPTGITEGPDGNIWFLETAANQVACYHVASSTLSEYAIPTVNSGAAEITTGADGDLWFTELTAGKIAEINPATGGIIEYPALPAGSKPLGIVTGPDRNIWFTESGIGKVGMYHITTPVAGPAIKEYPIITGGAGPEGITTGPGGNLYFTEESVSKIGQLNAATGAIKEYTTPTPAEQPMSIAAGADGNVYFTEFGGLNDQIGMLNPSSGLVQEIPVPGLSTEKNSIAAGPDNNIWFTDVETNQLEQYNLTTHAFTPYTIPFTSVYGTCYPVSLISGPGGDLWFSAYYANEICSFNPTTHQFASYAVPTSGGYPNGLTVGPDGDLWFAESFGNKIGQLNPLTGAFNEFSVPTTGSYPDGIATGSDGSLWFTELKANQIGQINPSTGAIVEYPIPTTASGPEGVTAGPDGNIWFTEGKASQVGKIAPPGALAQLVVTSSPPNAVTAGSGFGMTVVAEDSDGNLVYGFSGNVTVALGSNPGSATLGGTLTVAAVHGVAAFSGLTISRAGTGYTLKASGSGLSVTSSGVTVASAAATQLVVTAEPPDGVAAGTSFGLTVSAENSVGTIDPSFSGQVTVTMGSDPGDGQLGGALTATAKNGVATFSGLTISEPGSGYTLAVTGGGLSGAETSSFAVSAPLATHWVIITPPSGSVAAGSEFGLVVAAESSTGVVVTSFSGSASVAIAKNPGTATLGGTLSANVVDGLATFSDLTLNRPANGYTLTISGAGLAAATSGSITVTPGVATKLVVTAQPPASVAAGTPFGLTVSAEDTSGNVDPNFSGMVAVALGSNPGSAELSGVVTATASHGVASFLGLSLNRAGSGYTLRITDENSVLTQATSQAFNVTAPAVSMLVITAPPPAAVTAGQTFTVSVAAEDSVGDIVTTYTGNVTVTLSNNPGGSVLGGTKTEPLHNGVAVFADLTLNRPGIDYTLKFTSGSLTPATSGSIDTMAGPATHLAFTAQPPNAVAAGAGIGVTVAAEDDEGNIDPKFSGLVTIAMDHDDTGAMLQGTLATVAASGVAKFNGLSLSAAGPGYTLRVSDAPLAPAISDPFDVDPGPAVQWAMVQQPPSGIVAGSPFELMAVAEDALGNRVTAFNGNATVSMGNDPGGATLSGSLTVAANSGAAFFSGLTMYQAGSLYSFVISGAGLAAAGTSPMNVGAGAAMKLAILAPPPNVTSTGSPFGLMVEAVDSWGNVAASFDGVISVSSYAGSLGGPLSTTAAGGVATFSGLTFGLPGVFGLEVDGIGPTVSQIVTVNQAQSQTPPRVVGCTPMRTRRGLTGIIVAFDQPLDPSSAANLGLFVARGGVPRRHRTTYVQRLQVRVSYKQGAISLTVMLARPYRGPVQLTIGAGLRGATEVATTAPITSYE